MLWLSVFRLTGLVKFRAESALPVPSHFRNFTAGSGEVHNRKCASWRARRNAAGDKSNKWHRRRQ